MDPVQKRFQCHVAKVDSDQGLVFGYAMICQKDGKDYYDLQNEHIPESVMLEMAADFMKNSRVAKAMHDGDPIGEVVFAFPLTADVAKALDIQVKQTGLVIAMAPGKEALAKFAGGEFTGFSIGGFANYVEVEDEEDEEDESEEDSK